MLNRSASLAMSTCVLKALPGKLDIKRHSPSILYVYMLYTVIAVIHTPDHQLSAEDFTLNQFLFPKYFGNQ